MIQLTTEQKVRVFGMYIGQMVRIDAAGCRQGVLTHEAPEGDQIGMRYAVNHGKLILRPLSKITMEDARALSACYWIPEHANEEDGVEIIEDITSGDFMNDYSLNQAWEMYTFLISKGYAVPLFFSQDDDKYGKTAIELGLAVDCTQDLD